MPTFTLDSNCIIALENNERTASAIRELVDAHERGNANVAVVAISASENRRDSEDSRDFAEFQRRLAGLGLGRLDVLRPIFYFDITYWDWCLWADESTLAFERQIHEILFPAVEFLWSDFCAANALDPTRSPLNRRWRNCKCDVLALWSHIHSARNIFVTSDEKFHAVTKKPALIVLGAGRIERPEAAVALV